MWRYQLLLNRKIQRQYAMSIEEARKGAVRERDALLDSLGHAYLLVDATSHIQFANATARKLLSGRNLEGRTIIEAFLDEKLAVALLKCIRTGKPIQKKVVLTGHGTPLGAGDEESTSAWMIEAAPHQYDESQLLTCVILRNITSEYQSEQIRQDFVANASHELRTPMAIIRGYLENLLDDDMLDDPVISRRFLGVMQKHSNRISRIVEDMLAISQLESGESPELNIEAFTLSDCLDDVADRLSSLIAKNEACLEVDLEPSGLQLTGDRFYWAQVFFNLIENALKENPKAGLVVRVVALQNDRGTTISVCDNGKGIPSDALAYIFKRFYRVDKHHSNSEIKGTGLGLSIVKRAVEAHAGTITVASTPAVETRFTITLPKPQ